MADEARAARQHLLESLSMYSDELMELLLAEEEPPPELIYRRHAVGRRRSWSSRPVFLGSAYQEQGRAAAAWTPSSAYCPRRWTSRPRRSPRTNGRTKKSDSMPDPDKPTVAMAFKIVEDPYGTLTFMRIYQGTVRKRRNLLQPAHRPQGALQPHRADARRPARGHRRGRGRRHRGRHGRRLRQRRHLLPREPNYCTLQNMFVPEPVIRMAIAPIDPRRRRPAEQGPAPLPPRRPDVARLDRRGDRRDDHRRHGRVAPGNLRRTHSPRIQASRSKSARRR